MTTTSVSPIQERFWAADQFGTARPVQHVAMALAIDGDPDIDRLEQALDEVVARHPVLRARLRLADGRPVLEIGGPSPRLDRVPALAPGADPRRRLRELAERPFDVKAGPLLRACLVQADGDVLLGLTAHRAVADHASLYRLAEDLADHYAGVATPATPQPPPAQDGDDAIEAYRGELAGATLALDLPLLRPPLAIPGYRGAHADLRLPADVVGRVHALAADEGTEPAVVYLAAFQALLHRYTRQAEVVVGAEIDRRPDDSAIGAWSDLVPVRSSTDHETDFRRLLRSSAGTFAAVAERAPVPLPALAGILGRESAEQPLRFAAAFALRPTPPVLERDGLRWYGEHVDLAVAESDVELLVSEDDAGAAVRLTYDVDLVDGGTAWRMGEHYRRLLEGALAHGDQPFRQLELLGPEDHRLLERWGTAPEIVGELRPVFEYVSEHASSRPDALAATHGGERLTYGELNARANLVAAALRARGVTARTPVAVCMERSIELLVGLIGVHKAGAVAVMLDPKAPDERLATCIAITEPQAALTLERRGRGLPFDERRTLLLDSDWAEIAGHEGHEVASGVGLQDLSHLVFTSGSTGEPKAVALPHLAVAHVATVQHLIHFIGPDDGGVWLFPPSSSASASVEIWPYLVAGAAVHIAPDDVVASPPALQAWLLETGVTHCFVATSLAELLFTLRWPDDAPLRLMLIGGDRVRRWARPTLPFEVANWYGCAEATAVTTSVYPWEHRLTSLTATEEDRISPPPIGTPVPGVRIHVVDEDLRPVPPGVVGELCATSQELARGYLRPAQTAERFLPDPFGGRPGGRLYRTGDLVRFRPDGVLVHCGRVDLQVKIRSFRVEVGDIEAALMAHPTVAEAVVLAPADDRGERRLVAYTAPRSAAGGRELRSFLSQRLPDYMVPVAYVPVERLPLNAHGKVDRAQLPPPRWEELRERADYAGARDELERRLVAIWSETLSVTGVGLDDNFFLLGGDSLAASRAVSRIHAELGVEVKLRDYVLRPTPRELAELIRAAAPPA